MNRIEKTVMMTTNPEMAVESAKRAIRLPGVWAATISHEKDEQGFPHITVKTREYPFRIGICGAECSGKTTLARELSSRLNLPLVEEVAGSVPRERRRTMAAQLEIIRKQIEAESKHPFFVSDRTVFDNAVYSMYRFINSHQTEEDCATLTKISQIMTEHLNKNPYTHLFFVDEYFPLVDNGIRDIDPEQQKIIFKALKEIISLSPVPVYPISGSTEERVRDIISILWDTVDDHATPDEESN